MREYDRYFMDVECEVLVLDSLWSYEHLFDVKAWIEYRRYSELAKQIFTAPARLDRGERFIPF